MKKTVILMLCVSLLTGCQNNSQTKKAAKKAIEILDGYLNMDISASDAHDQLDELYDRVKAMPDDNNGDCRKSFVATYILSAQISLTSLEYSYLINTDTNDDDIIEVRDKLKKGCKVW